MKNLMMTAMLAALTATTAAAEGIKPQPEPIKPPLVEEPAQSGGGDDLLPILLGVILVGIVASNRQASDLSERRPLVRPQTCMSKVGGVDMIVACDD